MFGYPDEVVQRDGFGALNQVLLNKPFCARELAAALDDALRAAG